jgi:uncharacterized protein
MPGVTLYTTEGSAIFSWLEAPASPGQSRVCMKKNSSKPSVFSRRNFLFGSGALAAIAAVDAFGIEPNWLRVSEHDVPVANLPKMLDGYKIAQISDAHLRRLGPVEETIIREIRNRNVGLVLLTGDMIDNPARLPVLSEFCANLQGKQRTILAILGNWEHWANIPLAGLQDTYRSHGIKLLVNESQLIDSAIVVAAADDATNGNFSLSRTMRGYSPASVGLFLTHSPLILDRIPAAVGRFDLTLAGHTHGGQCRLGSFVPVLPPGCGRFVSGWYKIPTGRAYISSGTGTSVIPARFACRPELPIFSLRQESGSDPEIENSTESKSSRSAPVLTYLPFGDIRCPI